MRVTWRQRAGLRLLAAGMAVLGWVPAVQAQPDNTLTWLLSNFPPAIIIENTLPGRGFADDFVRYAVARMPEYTHVYEEASIARSLGLMQQGMHGCHPNLLITPERSTFVEFSEPVHITLQHHVLVRKDRVPRLAPYVDTEGAIDAARLVADPNLVTTITEKRGFPPVIAAALAAVKGQKQIVHANVDMQTPFYQLTSGWIDYVFAYPFEISWYTDPTNLPQIAAYTHIPIRGMATGISGHIACTKGPWGSKVIARINDIVREAGARPPWHESQLKFLDADSVRRLDELFAKHNPFRH